MNFQIILGSLGILTMKSFSSGTWYVFKFVCVFFNFLHQCFQCRSLLPSGLSSFLSILSTFRNVSCWSQQQNDTRGRVPIEHFAGKGRQYLLLQLNAFLEWGWRRQLEGVLGKERRKLAFTLIFLLGQRCAHFQRVKGTSWKVSELQKYGPGAP